MAISVFGPFPSKLRAQLERVFQKFLIRQLFHVLPVFSSKESKSLKFLVTSQGR